MLIALYTAGFLLIFGAVSYLLKRLNTSFFIFAASTMALSIGFAYITNGMVVEPLIISIILYYLSINVFTFILYGVDKSAAVANAWRISERQLHLYMFFGGVLGAILGQKIFRHKTQKLSFRIIFWLLLIIQISIPVALLAYNFMGTGSN